MDEELMDSIEDKFAAAEDVRELVAEEAFDVAESPEVARADATNAADERAQGVGAQVDEAADSQGDDPDGDREPAEGMPTSFGTVTGRLSEIAELVADESLSLDDALDLLEEAVGLGMQASDLLESDMEARDAAELDDEQEDAEGDEETTQANEA